MKDEASTRPQDSLLIWQRLDGELPEALAQEMVDPQKLTTVEWVNGET